VPLEIHIMAFDIVSFDARLQAMARPTYSGLVQASSQNQSSIVFVPTRKHARQTVMEILEYAAADGLPKRFLQAAEADIKAEVETVQNSALQYSLGEGIAFLQDTMAPEDRAVAERLFAAGAVQVLVVPADLCWGLTAEAQQVVIMGTQYYGGGGGGTDYPITDLLQMMGRAVRARDASGRCMLLCHGPKKGYYKKFLFEPFPVESHLDAFLHDHLAAEVVTRTITTKQDAVDYLTWTFYYRRLAQNPNYYNLQGTSHRHLSDHLSDLIENTLSDLEQSRVIAIEDDMDLEPLNLGMIAAYYYITYTTIELFASSLTAKTKTKGLLEILSAASEFDELPLRPGEEEAVRRLLAHAPVAVDKPRFTDPHVKANALLQAHFSRMQISAEMVSDQADVLLKSSRLLQAMVDVISSSGWLSPALAAMEVAQMVAQGCWERDSPLLQLPHFTTDLAAAAAKAGVESVFDLTDMEDDARRELLQMSDQQLADVARFCNRYPDIEMEHALQGAAGAGAGDPVTVEVTLQRAQEGDAGPVDAARYPGRKDENWWLVVGDPTANTLLAIKRVKLGARWKGKLEFSVPEAEGGAAPNLMLYLMCDSYMGADQEYELELDVKECAPGSDAEADGAEAMAE
jgi:pre-mRNA-splicing helicase BRR2